MPSLSSADFAEAFGIEALPEECTRLVREHDFRYEFATTDEQRQLVLAKLFPQKRLYGTDWAQASVEIGEGLGRKYGWNLTGRQFDFFHPDPAFKLASNSAALTLTALEQVGERHAALLDYLRSQKPALCIHIEPIAELYDEDHLLDALALRYHRQRGYLDKFLTALRELESARQIEI